MSITMIINRSVDDFNAAAQKALIDRVGDTGLGICHLFC